MRVSAGALLCGALLALTVSPLAAGPGPQTVEFRGEDQAQWELVPSQRSVSVPRGVVFEAEIRIRNKSDREVLASVLTEASPLGSLVHLGCGPDFSLILKPGEAAVIPSSYFVPEDAPSEAGAFRLNYTVYSFEALTPDPRQVGRQIYAARCVSCHGNRGLGDGPIARFLSGGVSDLTPALRQKDDRPLLDAIAKGMGPMPSFAPVLTDSERQALLLHLRDLAKGAP